MQGWAEKVVVERGGGRGFHALKPPLDLEYMNEMHDWSLQAQDNDVKGKMARHWDEKACWLRLTAAEMKKAFNAKGEERVNVVGYEQLGVHF